MLKIYDVLVEDDQKELLFDLIDRFHGKEGILFELLGELFRRSPLAEDWVEWGMEFEKWIEKFAFLMDKRVRVYYDLKEVLSLEENLEGIFGLLFDSFTVFIKIKRRG